MLQLYRCLIVAIATTLWISVCTFYHTAISYPESVQFQDIHMRVIIYDYRENVSLAEEGASCCIMR